VSKSDFGLVHLGHVWTTFSINAS